MVVSPEIRKRRKRAEKASSSPKFPLKVVVSVNSNLKRTKNLTLAMHNKQP